MTSRLPLLVVLLFALRAQAADSAADRALFIQPMTTLGFWAFGVGPGAAYLQFPLGFEQQVSEKRRLTFEFTLTSVNYATPLLSDEYFANVAARWLLVSAGYTYGAAEGVFFTPKAFVVAGTEDVTFFDQFGDSPGPRGFSAQLSGGVDVGYRKLWGRLMLALVVGPSVGIRFSPRSELAPAGVAFGFPFTPHDVPAYGPYRVAQWQPVFDLNFNLLRVGFAF